MGLEKASGSFGLLLTFMGVATLVGPPIGGVLFDWTKSYTLTYIIYGVSLVASALILLPVACARRRSKKREDMALKRSEVQDNEDD